MRRTRERGNKDGRGRMALGLSRGDVRYSWDRVNKIDKVYKE